MTWLIKYKECGTDRMMTKLNIVYNQYIKGDATFEEVYHAAARQREINRRIVATYGISDETAALEIFDDAMFDLLSLDKLHPDFEKALNSRLKSRRLNLRRNNNLRLSRLKSLDEMLDAKDNEGDAAPFIAQSEYNLEEEVLQRKKEADHLQVIDSLIRDCSPDATTIAVVEAYLFAPVSATRNEIASKLGIHHETIKRRLTALSRKYDATRFGDYRDYLAV